MSNPIKNSENCSRYEFKHSILNFSKDKIEKTDCIHNVIFVVKISIGNTIIKLKNIKNKIWRKNFS